MRANFFILRGMFTKLTTNRIWDPMRAGQKCDKRVRTVREPSSAVGNLRVGWKNGGKIRDGIFYHNSVKYSRPFSDKKKQLLQSQ